jgi:hypothetical protein
MIMKRNDKRLSDLERKTSGKSGHAVLYKDPNQHDCYWENYPFGPPESRGKRYSQAEMQALEEKTELVIINFVTEWRSNGEPKSAFG